MTILATQETPPRSVLERERRLRGWTKADAARRCGTDRAHYGRIEALETKPSPELADAIEKAFGRSVTRDQLLFPEDYSAAS